MKSQPSAWKYATRRQFLATSAATVISASLGEPTEVARSSDSKGGAGSLPLSGSDWFIREDSSEVRGRGKPHRTDLKEDGWTPARVPGNIQADLEAAHLLSPLWYGLGDPHLAEVAKTDWWYRKDFNVPQNFASQRATVVFDGVDHECEVWLNGERLGTHEGMYKRFWFDVTGLLRIGKTNRLEVKIARMPEALAAVFASSDNPGGSEVTKAATAVRLYLKDLKSPTNCAYDWAFAVWTLGIWKDVRLEMTGPVRIDWVRVQSRLSDNYTKASIKATLEIDSVAPGNVRARFRIMGHGARAVRTVEAVLKKGTNEVEAVLPLDSPALWWPNGQGEQALYELESSVVESASGVVSDTRTTRFAVREVEWKQAPGAAPDFINPLKLVLNGRPIRQMGSNLVPPDLLFGRINQRGPRLIEQAQAAGMNMLRVWEGGVTLPDQVYDRADELGIMLMQGFALANCMPERDAVFLSHLEATATSIIKQVRNHPSIVEWSGGSELAWQQGTDHPALKLLERSVRQYDGRILRATEPAQGSAVHGTYTYVYHNAPAPYLTWLGAGKEKNLYEVYDGFNSMRLSEFGTNSPANLEVWHQTVPPASQWPLNNTNDPVLIRKNVFWGAALAQNWLHKEITESLFGSLDGLENLIRAGQFLGAEGVRYAMDSLRRAGPRIAGGFMSWDFNEPWPNGAGSYMVDFYGRPLMNYSFVKQALAPVSLSLKYDNILFAAAAGLHAELWMVSDAPRPASGLKWKWLARDRRGEVLGGGEGLASIDPIETRKLADLSVRPPARTASGPVFIEIRLADQSDKLLTERIHIFGASGLPGTLGGLLRSGETDSDDAGGQPEARPVSRTAVSVSAGPVRVKGKQEELELRITNTGKMTALFCEPHPLLEYRTDLSIENNHAFVPPGESRTIAIRAAAKVDELSLAETGWRVTCWNSPDVVIEPVAEVLLSVGRKDAMCREFLGYDDPAQGRADEVVLTGRRPDASHLPNLLAARESVRFNFTVDQDRTTSAARLRIHTADQSKDVKPVLKVAINGWTTQRALAAGLGAQNTHPDQLAFPATAQIAVPAGALKPGANDLRVEMASEGWITWDSLDLVAARPGK